MNIEELTDDELISMTDQAVRDEKLSTISVIRLFREVLLRDLYLARGYPTFFDFATKRFNYCGGSAQLRIHTMRLIIDVPEAEALLESDDISLSVAALLQTFFYAQKLKKKPFSASAKIDLLAFCIGKSVLQIQRELKRLDPESRKRDSKRAVSENETRLSHTVSNETAQKLERIKIIWSNVDPDMKGDQLLSRMAEIVLDKVDPLRKDARAEKRKSYKGTKAEKPDSVAEVYPAGSEGIEQTKVRVSSDHPFTEIPNGAGEIQLAAHFEKPLHMDEVGDRGAADQVGSSETRRARSPNAETAREVRKGK